MYDGQKSKLLEIIFSQARMNRLLIQKINKLEEENKEYRLLIEMENKRCYNSTNVNLKCYS